MAGGVGAHISVRTDQRIAHARLRAEMDDAIDVTAAQGGFEPFPIGEILVEHAQVAALRDDARDPGALHGGIVIIVEIVDADHGLAARSEEHTSELQSLMRNSYAGFCLKKTKTHNTA